MTQPGFDTVDNNTSIDLQQQLFQVVEKKPDHHYRTEIPNIIFQLGLDPYELTAYSFLKLIAGDYGKCWCTIKTLAEKAKMSERKLQECLKKLSSPLLNGMPLIVVTQRKKADGSNDSNIIEITDIWSANGKYFRQGAPNAGGGAQHAPGGAPGAVKEEPLNKDLKGNDLDTEETLPFKKKEMGDCKFPLKKEQRPLFDALCSLDLECDKKTLMIIVRSHIPQKIIDAVNHLKYEIEKGTVFKRGKIAFLRALLKGKMSVVTESVIKAKNFAMDIKKRFNWHSLKISDKFVTCEKCLKEVPLNLPMKEFCRSLEELHDLSKQY